MIGWVISLAGAGLAAVAHTPLALVGTVLLVPGLLSMPLVISIGRRIGLSDATMLTASLISMAVFASLFYGAVAFIVIRFRAKTQEG
jgi:hypothetical protein